MLAFLLLVGCRTEPPPPAPETPAPAGPPAPEVSSPPVEGLHLRGLRASSGGELGKLLDNDPGTGWTPDGDPVDESVTLRFETPVRVTGLELSACADAPQSWWNVIVNGAEAGRVDIRPGAPGWLAVGPGGAGADVASLQLRVADGRRGTCLAAVVLKDGEEPMAIRPPRSVAGGVRSSSVRVPTAAHHPWYLIDGRPDFSWTEGKEGTGVGESFTIALEKPLALTAVEIWNGDQRSPEAFVASGRARRVGISVDRGGFVSFPVADTMGPQRLPLPRVMGAKLVTIAILEVVTGRSYDDLDVSEVRLWDPMGPVSVVSRDLTERTEPVRAQLASTGLGSVVDRRLQQVCPAAGERRLKLRDNLSFSYLGPSGSADGLLREVFEGDWAPRVDTGPWTQVLLSGRRHPMQMSWVGPEADREDLSVVQDAELARVQDLGPEAFAELLKGWERGPQRFAVECVAAEAKKAGVSPFDFLVTREAILVRGKAFTDLLAPAG